jgi:monoamine oxidase
MGGLGGAGAVYETLVAWDLLKPPPALAAEFVLPAESGKGKTVAILGGGVSGLCAAYELDRAGYDCIVLEAQRRAGGRSLTLRRGDTVKETGEHPAQVCQFDEGLWFNAGPGRIAHHHVRVIDYCRRFGVALQPYIFANRASLVHTGSAGNGNTVPIRRTLADMQGYIAELLSKCVATPGVDLPVSGADVEKLQDMLASFGDLTKTGRDKPSYSYLNKSGRGGYDVPPGSADHPPVPLNPITFDEILRSEVWKAIYRENAYSWQTTLLEPVGGMDNFVKAFLRQPLSRQAGTIDGLIRYGAKVIQIDVRSDKVAILFDDGGSPRVLTADYCISTIPVPVFANLKTNLPPAIAEAARNMVSVPAAKVGWQAERFWERENIYGGISWTSDTITQIWYPSSGFLSRTGILTGAYIYGPEATAFNARPVAERLQIARDQGERLHEGYSKNVGCGIAVGWDNMEFARMGFVYEGVPSFGGFARTLSTPQGRFQIAGDQVTFWSGWQEGAILSAWNAVTAIDHQVRTTGRPVSPTGQ